MRLHRGDGEQTTVDRAWAAIERGDVERARTLLGELPHQQRRQAARELIKRWNHPSPLSPGDPDLVLDLFERAHREAVPRISEYAQGPAVISRARD